MNPACQKLLSEFCQLTLVEDVTHVLSGGCVDIEDVSFSFVQDDKLDTTHLFAYVAYGPPPDFREASVFYELLKRNFLTYAASGQAFTISPISGEVVLVMSFDVATCSAAQLLDSLQRTYRAAKDWRQTFFLRGDYQLRTQPPLMAAMSDTHFTLPDTAK